jgi:hypothetical protein
MKKLLYLFLAVSFIFAACKKDDDNQFSGNWTGTYTGDDSGIWTATITTNGEVNGNSTNANGDLQSLSGTVTNSGTFSATVGTGSLGSSFTGTLSGNNGVGVWENLALQYTGTWAGTK